MHRSLPLLLVPFFLSFFTIFGESNKTTLKRRFDQSTRCNGLAEACGLRFDQYTFFGTHNSQAYNVKVDCSKKSGFVDKLKCDALSSDLIENCLYNNQEKHDIGKQLEDGIRAFDIDTGIKDGTIKACHGDGDLAAYGDDISSILKVIKDFLSKNPNEVLSLEFDDMTGDSKQLCQSLVKLVQDNLGDYLHQHDDKQTSWPTLGEMVSSGKRVVAFVNHKGFDNSNPAPAWALDREKFYKAAWEFTNTNKDPTKLCSIVQDHCDNNKDDIMLACDFEFSIDLDYAKGALNALMSKFGGKPDICIADAAATINPSVADVVRGCQDKKKIHRVRVDHYWETNLRDFVDELNKKNAGHFLYNSSTQKNS